MSSRKRVGIALIGLSLTGAFGSAVARAGVGINTLRGIDRVKVVIEDLTSDSTIAGVTEEQLRAQSVSALKQIGVTVIADADGASAQSLLIPVLYLSLSTERMDGFHTFLIRLELLQAVSLARNPMIKASSATTWSVVRFGRVNESSYASKMRSIVTIILQSFQDDYLSVNPASWPPRDRPGTTGPAGYPDRMVKELQK